MRGSGILMHITSLPGPYGIGTMGKAARSFVDFLREAGQSHWQILPLTPTGFGNSPYQSCCAFAGNPYLIDLDTLVEEGLLEERALKKVLWQQRHDRVDFGLQHEHRLSVLARAFDRFAPGPEFEDFCQENREWLEEFVLFMALKERFGGKPWFEWEAPLRLREEKALEKARRDLANRLDFFRFVQYLFFRQWNALHRYAGERGITIVGDVPIYLPYDSVEVWCSPELFQMDENRVPTAVAGCPPDGFTADGQLWGNPLYRWEYHKKTGFRWWIRRLAAAGRLYDVVRLDHFRGFDAYWSVPFGEETARNGRWVQGPGSDFVDALREHLPELSLIAEDLGYLTPEVMVLRDRSGYPGMKVLEFAFDSREPSDYLPHTYTRNTVCYTGTHDNMTMSQWFATASPEAVAYAREYMGILPADGDVWGAIRTVFRSVSDLVIIPMQDYLELGAEGRMNLPGSLSDCNWTWRAKDDIMNKIMAQRIRRLTELYGRLPE